MTAAEFSSMKKTKPSMQSWTITKVIYSGQSLVTCHLSLVTSLVRMGGRGGATAPGRRNRTTRFAHVRLVLMPEILQCRQRRCGRGVAERTQRLPRDEPRHIFEQREVLHFALAALNLFEN